MSQFPGETTIEQHRAGLRAAIRILKAWGFERPDQARILNIDHALIDAPETLERTDQTQLKKISYLLNIHASLKELFQNPENHSGFMMSVNQNPPFYGQRPLDFVYTGEVDAIKEVFESLELLKYGQ
ncbi:MULTISPECIES: hypothetical protein [Marinobacter]|uniref:hypothetical protein n=1 Tax=Marinobacter TaxID=2742 RepID=UPI001B0E8F44|nr:hypothetical protein [Marinobacter sp.]MBO6813102.1 hypothetical protein [Marinobacter sp.]